MNDYEYAACIYCRLFKSKKANNDIYIDGILNEIKTLTEREQFALEYYYRNDMTYMQVGKIMGISGSGVGKIIQKALLKLNHPSRSNNMRVPVMIENYKKELKNKDNIINDLYCQIKNLLQGKTINSCSQYEFIYLNMEITQMDFTTRTYNALLRAGFNNIESLLALDDFYDLWKIRNLGKIGLFEIIEKMREYGYIEWAEKMQSESKAYTNMWNGNGVKPKTIKYKGTNEHEHNKNA